ncbi:MAG: CPBP family intramembrane metalloprotease [Armatimonadetes bacterium]|nr:CPBP family intramembrane metalloprotease [Armatimonadota bacterium]
MGGSGERVGQGEYDDLVWLPLPLLACLLLRDTLGSASFIWPIGALLVGTLLVARRLRVPAQPRRLRGVGLWLLGGVAAAGAFRLWPAGHPSTFDALWLALCVPVVEECYFRGLVWDALASRGKAPALGVATALFVVAHLGATPWPEALAMGLAFGAARWLGGSVWCAVALHAGWNGGVVVGPAMGLVALAVGLIGLRGDGHGRDHRLGGPRGG